MDQSQIPQNVQDALAQRFPGVNVKDWEVETEYEAEFEENGKEVEVNISAEGEITQIEYEMDPEHLPQMVKDALMRSYPYCEITEAERVEKANGQVLYEVSLSFQVHMTPDGNLAALGKDL